MDNAIVVKNTCSIVFLPTLECNVACKYCFERHASGKMTMSMWRRFYEELRILAEAQKIKHFKLHWQGGEILTIGADYAHEGIEIGEEIFKDTGILLEYHLQSNMIAYESDWAPLIREFFRNRISSSMDYPNLFRMSATLTPDDYTRVWLEKKAQAESDGFLVSAISLPNQGSIKTGAEEFYRFYKETAKVTNLQINFPFPGRKNMFPLEFTMPQFASFVEDLYDVWDADKKTINLSPFVFLDASIRGGKNTRPCIWSYSCGQDLFCVSPDGRIGQCDCWLATYPEFDFGHINDGGFLACLNSKNHQFFLKRPVVLWENEDCGSCEFWNLCHGGCPVRAFSFTGDINAKDSYCEVYKKIFRKALQRDIRQ